MGCAASKDPSSPKSPKPHPGESAPVRAAPAEPDCLGQWQKMAAAWGEGAFAGKDKKAQLSKFVEKDMVWDASAATGLADFFKVYKGVDGMLQWLDMIGDFEWVDLEMLPIKGAEPRSVLHRFSSQAKSAGSGKQFTGFTSDMIVWKYSAAGKVASAKIYFGQAEQYAWVLDKTGSFPRPPKLARMPTPTASPDKAHGIFAEIYGMWGSGKFADPATKDEAMAAKWAPEIMMDTTSWCQSKNGIFKLRHGFAGGDEWVNTVLADWELSNLDMELKGCPAPPNPPGCQPGTVAAFFTYDVKHKTSGKELKGQCDIMEWYLSSDGKCLGGKFYFGNPLGLSSIYPPAPAIPESVALFFDGTPITTEKIAKIEPTMSDSAILEFIGPYTGLTTGIKMPKPAIVGKVMPLFASAFPDSFIFNADKATVQKTVDGGYAANIRVTGTHNGTPFTPDPEKLPPITASEPPKSFDIGPETFTLYVDDEGKVVRTTICPLSPGARNGPPGIYAAIGGNIPPPPHLSALCKGLTAMFEPQGITGLCTDDCMLTLAGQTMPVSAFQEVCTNLKTAYPDWVFSTTDCGLQPDMSVKMGTQQTTGPMKADLPACGPLPGVKLADAPEKIKQGDGLIVPVEIGQFWFNADGTKITKMVWDGELGDTSKSNCMHHNPPVGMPVLFAEMGAPLPPP